MPAERFGCGVSTTSVKVIAHQAAGMHLPAGLRARLAQGRQEALAILVIGKDLLGCSPSRPTILPAGLPGS